MSNDHIAVCYAGNKKVFSGLYLSCLSLAKHSSKPLDIYVFTMDLSSKKAAYVPISIEQGDFLQKKLQAYNSQNTVTVIDVTDKYKKTLYKSANSDGMYTPYALLRLFISSYDFIPDKCIYLDIDTMAVNDIDQLYSLDISQYEFAAALDFLGCFWIRKDYSNSGVMLLNLKLIRERNLFTRALEMVRTRKMTFPDQTALYDLSKDRLIMNGRFNEQRDIKPDTVIKHFCKGIKWLPFFKIYNIKQWDIENVHSKLHIHDFDDIYAIYSKDLVTYPDIFKTI